MNQIDDREVLCELPSISLSNTAGELHTKANVEFAPHHCEYCFADKYGKVSDLVRVLKAWRSRATQRGDDDDDKTVSCSSCRM